jgi:hypothetical protein
MVLQLHSLGFCFILSSACPELVEGSPVVFLRILMIIRAYDRWQSKYPGVLIRKLDSRIRAISHQLSAISKNKKNRQLDYC